jgi:short-subunit dehydrogenase
MNDWLHDVFHDRPWWMNTVMVFCAYMTFVYMPWDIFIKPVAEDKEVWFGVLFAGASAKLLAIPHWIVYAAGLYGFRRNRPWMIFAAPLYVAQVAIGMFVWPILFYGSLLGFVLGVIAAVPFIALTLAFWNARDVFEPAKGTLSERYGAWAIVTGASAGIGAAFAKACAGEGLNCVLVARRTEQLETLAEALRSEYAVETRVLSIDLCEPGAANRLAAATTDLELGVLINNAGFGSQGRFEQLEVTRLEEMIQLNCTVPMSLTHQVLPGMRERGRGAIVVVGSAAGHQPLPLHGVYSATKAFDLFFGESLWAELRGSGIDVLVVEPGSVETEFQSVSGQIAHSGARPQEVVAATLAALGRQPSVIVGWGNWLRANFATRLATRPLVAYISRQVMESRTPVERR